MKIGKLALRLGAAALISTVIFSPSVAQRSLTDAQIKQEIIRQSIENYPGNCPCPYNTASNGSRCGGRSAYSRGGGYAPMCYAADVSAAQIAAYRRRG